MSALLGRYGVPVVAVLLAAVLLTAVGFAALQPSTASAPTLVLRGDAVVATLPDGTREPLEVGDEVPRGATVEAGRDGAVLRTRDRETWLGGDAELLVVDGVRQELRAGFVMVDSRSAPALDLATPTAEITVPAGTVTRVERGSLLRVGSFAGDRPVLVRAAGRRATAEVSRDYQVQVPEGGLPGDTSPLVLTGDRYERALAPSLVAADDALTDIARRLDADTTAGVVVLQAADQRLPRLVDGLRSDPVQAAVSTDLPPGAPRSERSLAFLLARGADGDEELRDAYERVRELRGAGGSWGVVADIVGAEVEEVAALLDELLADTQQPVLAADEQPVDVEELLGGALATRNPTTSVPPAPSQPPPPSTPPAPPSSPPGPLPVPLPPPPPTEPVPELPEVPVYPDEPGPLVGVVGGVTDAVLGLVGAESSEGNAAGTTTLLPTLQ